MERDSFFCALQRETASIFKKILSHPFVVGIGDGTLPEDKFRFYIKQDYLFLIEYSRVLALAAAKAQSLNTMEKFAALLHSTLNVEMDLHRQYAKEFGISRQELQRAEIAPTVRAYTDYLLQTAFSGDRWERSLLRSLPAGGDTMKSLPIYPGEASQHIHYIDNGSRCTPRRSSVRLPIGCVIYSIKRDYKQEKKKER